MRLVSGLFLLACLMGPAPAALADTSPEDEALAALEASLPGTLMNNPYTTDWRTNGANQSARVVRVREIPGEYAYEVKVRRAGRNPWDVSVTASLSAGVAAGDAVLVAFWARATETDEGRTSAPVQMRLQQMAAPYTGAAEAQVEVNTRWQLHYVKGIAPADYSSRDINLAFNVAAHRQTVQFGQVYVMNLGQGVRLEELPSGAEEL
ncbi:hypothetical protein [Hyphomonas sp.]|uniref:hypothetical protein n=1 Tax=Hyphomonas sp. TaxID=87 RepID=UPI00391AB2D4